jgi:hypothetical protein
MFSKIVYSVKIFIIGIILICIFYNITACVSNTNNTVNNRDELEIGIREISNYLNSRIEPTSKVAFLNIQSNFPDLSEYIISILSENAVNDNLFFVVDRHQLDLVRSELNFHLSGEVSDVSAQSIGQMLGAQVIVSGTITKIGTVYRLQIKAIGVQSAAILGQLSHNIPEDKTILALTRNQSGGTASSSTSGGNRTNSSSRNSNTATSAIVNIRWTVGEYANEWGDKLGKFYVQYDGNTTASFSNSAITDEIRITEISYSKHEGLSFRTPSTTGYSPISNTQINVIIRNNDGTETNFTGIWGSPTRPYVVIRASDELVNALSANNITIRVTDQSRRFQFTFPPNFQQAYERLLNRENIAN